MGGKRNEKKKLKLEKLYEAAYNLLNSNGVRNTIVDDIAKKAGVAKGTFYLYFKDKDDLIDKVIIRKTSMLLNEAMEALARRNKLKQQNFQQSVIFISDYLIHFFENDKNFLELVHGKLSLNLYKRLLHSKEIEFAKETFIQNYVHAGGNPQSAKRRLFIIVDMICSVCYNTLSLEFPYRFDEIKDDLYDSIGKILTA